MIPEDQGLLGHAGSCCSRQPQPRKNKATTSSRLGLGPTITHVLGAPPCPLRKRHVFPDPWFLNSWYLLGPCPHRMVPARNRLPLPDGHPGGWGGRGGRGWEQEWGPVTPSLAGGPVQDAGSRRGRGPNGGSVGACVNLSGVATRGTETSWLLASRGDLGSGCVRCCCCWGSVISCLIRGLIPEPNPQQLGRGGWGWGTPG